MKVNELKEGMLLKCRPGMTVFLGESKYVKFMRNHVTLPNGYPSSDVVFCYIGRDDCQERRVLINGQLKSVLPNGWRHLKPIEEYVAEK